MKSNRVKLKLTLALVLALALVFGFGAKVLAATNLLTNPGAETGSAAGWSNVVNGGGGWAFNWDDIIRTGSYSFQSSYNWCSMDQTVNLLTAGYTEAQLDAQPEIIFTDYVKARIGNDSNLTDPYYLTFSLLKADLSVAATYSYGTQASPLYIPAEWTEKTYTFSGYGAGVRYIYFKQAGRDSENWGGNYGAHFDDASVTISVVADTTNPSVSAYFPALGTENVSTTPKLILTFDEAVDAESGDDNNINIYQVGGSLVESIDAQDATKVSGSGTVTIEITPEAALEEQADYYITVGADAFDDASGNSYDGILADDAWTFATGDFTNPSVLVFFPGQDATGVTTTAKLILTFNEAVTASSSDIVIYKTGDDSIFQTIAANSDSVNGSGTATIEIESGSDFDYETSYYVTIDAAAFDDSSGNSYAGVSDSSIWNFTTEDTPVCATVAHAASYNAYPTCGVAACQTGYTLVSGSFAAVGGAAIAPLPAVGAGAREATIGISETKQIATVDAAGVNVLMYVWAQANFQTQLSSDSSLSDHSAYLQDVDLSQNIIKVLFKSEPVEVKLALGESREVDLNRDGISDIKAAFSDLKVNRVELTLVDLKNKVLTSSNQEETNKTETNYNFVRNLHFGSSGEDIKELQKYLNQNGFKLAQTGPGSPGRETIYFGSLTRAALAAFQKDNKINPAAGYFGPITRSYIEK